MSYQFLEARAKRVDLDVSSFPEGVYFYEMRYGTNHLVKKFVVQR